MQLFCGFLLIVALLSSWPPNIRVGYPSKIVTLSFTHVKVHSSHEIGRINVFQYKKVKH